MLYPSIPPTAHLNFVSSSLKSSILRLNIKIRPDLELSKKPDLEWIAPDPEHCQQESANTKERNTVLWGKTAESRWILPVQQMENKHGKLKEKRGMGKKNQLCKFRQKYGYK